MVNFRISTLLLASAIFASTNLAQDKPYSPDLYDRSALLAEDEIVPGGSFVRASRPYAPNLFDRASLLDEDELEIIQKRSIAAANSVVVPRSVAAPRSSSTWNPFSKRSLETSEEELHERGEIPDSVIEARGWCGSDWQCGDSQYCSTTRHKCYRKLSHGDHCSRDGACGSGYCCESDSVCKPKRQIGSKCHSNNGACDSGYCSVVSDKCHPQSKKNEGCRVDSGCRGSLSCVNRTCQDHKPKPDKPDHSKPNHPDKPSPSGSWKHPRKLSHTEV